MSTAHLLGLPLTPTPGKRVAHDGADAGRFTTTIKDRLETGNFIDELELS